MLVLIACDIKQESSEITDAFLGEITLMKCPFCSREIAAAWQLMLANTDPLGRQIQAAPSISSQIPPKEGVSIGGHSSVQVYWLICQNEECRQIVVQVRRNAPPAKQGDAVEYKSWIVVPERVGLPSVDASVPKSMREDYLEAWKILDDSPRMSAVLARRVLADLLKTYANFNQFSLTARIDEFVEDTQHPSRLRENLHYLREMGDMSAHTQEAQVQPPAQSEPATSEPPEKEIINVSLEEAQWTLKVVEDLFDYFIVAPEKDKRMRASFDQKIKAAGRKPLT